MEQRVRTALAEGRIEDEALLEGVRLEKVVSPASTKQAMIARVSMLPGLPPTFFFTLPCLIGFHSLTLGVLYADHHSPTATTRLGPPLEPFHALRYIRIEK